MKKICSLLLVFCIVFSLSVGVYATEKSKDKVSELILISKEKINISDDNFEFENYYENMIYGEKIYNFYWKSIIEDYYGIDVSIKEDGTIISFDKSYKRDYSVKFLDFSKNDVKKIAKEFLEKFGSPKEIKEPEISKSGETYTLYYKREHNGIEVDSNYIRISISGKTGEVIGYNLSWDDLTFNETEVISNDDAKEIYKKELGYDLFYIIKSENYENTAKLLYKPKYNETAYIDAEKGIIKTNNDLYTYGANGAMKESVTADFALMKNASLSEKELELVNELNDIISIEEALSIAKKMKEFEIDDSFTVESSSIYKENSGKFIISLSLVAEKDKNYFYKNVSIDGISKKITSYNSYQSLKAEEKEFDNEKGRKTAENFLKKYYAEEFENSTPVYPLIERKGRYEYKKTVNGIKISNNGLKVTVDINTGKINSFTYTEYETNYPSPEDVKEITDVYEKLLDAKNFSLKYVLSVNDEKGIKKEPVLVYSVINTPTYDAKTLEEVSEYTFLPEETFEKPEYTDISGHYAEERIKTLLEEDIYLEGNELRPDDAITFKEFTSLLYMMFTGSEPRPLESVYKNALSYFGMKDITKEDSEKISRLEAIKMLLDHMGYKEFASIKGIFDCPFKDINEEDKGYGAIAAGLGLISTADSNFYKDSDLKRADALIIIYNYMAR